MQNIRIFYLKILSFLEIKFSIYLNRRVFVMMFCTVCCLTAVFGGSITSLGKRELND